ncbi:Retrovirus-related Pol polyprotein from transposon TNT 1-94 [Linum perenne]
MDSHLREVLQAYLLTKEVESEKMIGRAEVCDGLYLLKGDHPKTNLTSSTSPIQSGFSASSLEDLDNKVMLWHFRFGHPSFRYLAHLFPSLFINKKSDSFNCEVCQYSKHTRSVYPSLPYKSTHPFSIIHSDIWGPSKVTDLSGSRWYITFIDDHSRLTWTYLMKTKSETATVFKTFYQMIHTQFNTPIKVLHTDNAKDYFNHEINTFLTTHGIIHSSSCVETPQQNGIAERKNRHLLEVARALLFSSQVPKYLWGDAIRTATYLINRLPSRVLKFESPRQILLSLFPHITSFSSDLPLKVFGCTAFVHLSPQHRSKLEPRSLKCVFLGYSPNQNGYKCYNPSTRKTYHSKDVTFFESEPYFPNSSIQGEKTVIESQIWEMIEVTSPLNNTIHSSEPSNPSHPPQPRQPDSIQLNIQDSEPTQENPVNPKNPEIRVYQRRKDNQAKDKQVITHSQQSQDSNSNSASSGQGMSTHETEDDIVISNDDLPNDDLDVPIARRKGVRTCTSHPVERWVSYGNLSRSYQAFSTNLDSMKIPNNLQEALLVPEWKQAVMEEIKALEKNKTWTIETLPTGKKTVDCKWIFAIKYRADGKVDRFKARLVARGFTQSYGIDYQETFAPVAKLNTIRVLLSLAVNNDWNLHQLDIKNAFLNGDLTEEVYMEIPAGVETKLGENKVCRLRKALYGLKQSPRAWFERFARAIKSYDYHQCQTDHTMFIKHGAARKITILIVYVDDIIITGDDEREINLLKQKLAGEFETKDLGEMKYFLGMEVARSTKGIILSQRKYIIDLLTETGMLGCKPAETPMETTLKFDQAGKPTDRGRYQRLVGKLIYLAHTRPDIAYAVSIVSQHMHDPTEDHLEAVTRILRYLKKSAGLGLLFQKQKLRNIVVYTDASWAGELTGRRSTSGYCTYVWGNLVTWRSKKQAVVSRSSAEAEFRALAQGICEGIWLRRVLDELKMEHARPVTLLCDNQAAISIVKNPVHHDRTKHVEIDRQFISEKVSEGIIRVDYVPSQLQLADIFTKALSRDIFNNLMSKLGLFNIFKPSLRGSVE